MQEETVSFEEYLQYAIIALSRYDIEELFSIWKQAAWMGNEGMIVRTLIAKNIESIANIYHLEAEPQTFPELVKEIDKAALKDYCGSNSSESCMHKAITENNLHMVKLIYPRAPRYAVVSYLSNPIMQERHEILRYLIKKLKTGSNLDSTYFGIARAKDPAVVNIALQEGVDKVQLLKTFLKLFSIGDLTSFSVYQLIEKIDQLTASELAEVLSEAVYANVARKLIEKFGPLPQKELDKLLVDSARQGRYSLVELFIKLGAKSFQEALNVTHPHVHTLQIMEILLTHGARPLPGFREKYNHRITPDLKKNYPLVAIAFGGV